jgi:hypothetical protein
MERLRTYLEYDTDLFNAHRRNSGRELVTISADEAENFIDDGMPFLSVIQDTIDKSRTDYSIKTEIYWTLEKSSPESAFRSGPRILLVGEDFYCIIFPLEWVYNLRAIFLILACSPTASANLNLPISNLYGRFDPTAWQAEPLDNGNPPDAAVVYYPDLNIASNPQASACSMLMLELCISAFIAHEFCHALHGHLRLISDGEWSEIEEIKSGATSENNVLRALEFDSDCFAVGDILRRTLSLVGQRNSLSSQDEDGLFIYEIGTPKTAALVCAVTLYALFRSFHANDPLDKDQWNTAHPPALYRAMLSIMQIEALLPVFQIEISDFMNEIYVKAIDSVEDSFRVLNSEYARPKEIDQVSTTLRIYSQPIGLAWNSVREKLNELKLGGGIAPSHTIVV